MVKSKRTQPDPPIHIKKDSRKWLEDGEVTAMIRAAGKVGRHGHRDSTMILIAYRHGLRNTELCELRWDQVNLEKRELMAERLKGSSSRMHTMELDEVRRLRKIPQESVFVFINENGRPFSSNSFHKIVARAGRLAKVAVPVHPHMLRHACGREMVKQNFNTRLIQDWLGHKSITNTEWYTTLDAGAFRRAGMWSRRGR